MLQIRRLASVPVAATGQQARRAFQVRLVFAEHAALRVASGAKSWPLFRRDRWQLVGGMIALIALAAVLDTYRTARLSVKRILCGRSCPERQLLAGRKSDAIL